MVTLLAALQKYDLKRGMAAVCIGGGEATRPLRDRAALEENGGGRRS